MDINNPQMFDHLIASSGEVLRIKVVPLGNWNMNVSRIRNINHGLDAAKILAVWISVRNDAGNWYGMAVGMAGAPYTGYGIKIEWSAFTVTVTHMEKGYYDNTDYDESPYARGNINILYSD